MEIPQEDLDLINSDKELTEEEAKRLGSYPLKKMLPKEFFKEIDPNLKLFARTIKEELRDAGHEILGLTGYPGTGKSNTAAILGALIDEKYCFVKNICFIPTSKEIEETYLGLPMYSYYHIDEASRGLHKHKWHDKIQQKINELYDTEREGHHLCTMLIMPRFQNFTENFRNFMITVWVHISKRGYAVFYKKDDDKDVKDPWHIDENYKAKYKKWKGKRTFERTLGDKIRVEQATAGYWFYCPIPKIPDNVWRIYQKLKAMSRVVTDEGLEIESFRDRKNREKMEKWKKIAKLQAEGKSSREMAIIMGCASRTITNHLKDIQIYQEMNGSLVENGSVEKENHKIIYNQKDNCHSDGPVADSDKVLNVTPSVDEVDKILEDEE